MRNILYSYMKAVFCKLLTFALIFITVQFTRELIFRPLVVHTIGPVKVERHIYVDNSFEENENLMIKQAAEQWEKKTNGIVTFKVHYFTTATEYLTLRDSKALPMTKVNLGDPFTEEVEDEAGKLLGLYTRRFHTELIVLNVDRIRDMLEFRATTMHELGHALGLEHNPREFTLMYPSEDFGAHSITKYDLAAFCEIYFCDPKKLGN